MCKLNISSKKKKKKKKTLQILEFTTIRDY